MSATTVALFLIAACVFNAANLEFARMVFTREAAIAADNAGNLYLGSLSIGTPAPEDRRGAMAFVKRTDRGEVQWAAFLGDYVSGPLAVAANRFGEVFVTGVAIPRFFLRRKECCSRRLPSYASKLHS